MCGDDCDAGISRRWDRTCGIGCGYRLCGEPDGGRDDADDDDDDGDGDDLQIFIQESAARAREFIVCAGFGCGVRGDDDVKFQHLCEYAILGNDDDDILCVCVAVCCCWCCACVCVYVVVFVILCGSAVALYGMLWFLLCMEVLESIGLK